MTTVVHEGQPSGNADAEALAERILDLEHELAGVARAPATLGAARRAYESFADDLASDALELQDQPGAATDILAAETTGRGSVAARFSYVAEVVDVIAGPTIKLDSTDSTALIRITDPGDFSVLALVAPLLGQPRTTARPGAPSEPITTRELDARKRLPERVQHPTPGG